MIKLSKKIIIIITQITVLLFFGGGGGITIYHLKLYPDYTNNCYTLYPDVKFAINLDEKV